MFGRIFVYIFFCVFFAGFSQTSKQKELETQKNQILSQIANFKELLNSEQNKEKTVVEQLEEQQIKINLTESLIKTTRKQEQLISHEIAENQKQIQQLTQELNKLKADYTQIIISSYQNRSQQSKLMFILSSDNFLQAYKRVQYMKQYAEFRKEQGVEIQQKSNVLAQKGKELQKQKNEKEQLLQQTKQELSNLEKDKKKLDALMVIIDKNKKKYVADISKKQQEIVKIDKQIEKIKREIITEANRKKAEAEAKATGKKIDTKKISSTTFALSPEAKIIAGNFKSNQGKLPWPVERGVVYMRYGVQPHPIEKKLSYDNKGVDFKTEEGAEAMAVFEGEVSDIMMPTPVNIFVFVRHGDYLTVYGNLDKIYVKKGEKVSFKQKLGRIHTYANGNTTMKFSVSHNITTLNPEDWLIGF